MDEEPGKENGTPIGELQRTRGTTNKFSTRNKRNGNIGRSGTPLNGLPYTGGKRRHG